MRYARQKGLIGSQNKLARTKVAVIGLGGLGCTAAQMLCRAGVGTLHLYDFDRVSLSDLHRQILYHEGDLGKSKARLAASKLLRMNSRATVSWHEIMINDRSIRKMPQVDLVLDCTDNLKTRRTISRHCSRMMIPWVHAAVDGESGFVCLFQPGENYERLWKGKRDARNRQILGTYPVIIGGLQATVSLNALSGINQGALHFDFKAMEIKKIKIGLS